MAFNRIRGVMTGAYWKKQQSLPLLLLAFGLVACFVLYALFSDPPAGSQWSELGNKVDGGGVADAAGTRSKIGALPAVVPNGTSISTAQPRTPELETPVGANATVKGFEAEDQQDPLPPPPPAVPSTADVVISHDEPEQVPPPAPSSTTKDDDSQHVPAVPEPPPPALATTTATVPVNASPVIIGPPAPDPVAADKPPPAPPSPSTTASPQQHQEELLSVLQRASMGNNTVILTTLNEAWAVPDSVLDLFFESFRIGQGTQHLPNHLVIIAVDPKAYERCKVIHPHCYLMVTEGMDFSKEELFMTPSYMDMMWRRLQFLGSIIELGFSFVFTDTDIMWFRNPFLHFDPSADLSIACDHYVGDPYNLYNGINGGFYYVRSNTRTIEFFKYWYRSRWQHPENNEQDVFNMIKGDGLVNNLGIHIRYLDTMYFSGFCEPTKYFGEVITMHANCCIGVQKKLDDLRLALEDWGNYTKLGVEERRYTPISWRVPKNC